MLALNLLRTQVKQHFKRTNFIQIRSKARFKDGGEHATLNDMPIPEGCWKSNHARTQNRYMMVLLSGIASFIGSWVYIAKWGEMEMNYSVPDYPYEEEEEGKEKK
ncbi:gomdanji [Cochliomyia hominivorax]